jgi:hypothetical protein
VIVYAIILLYSVIMIAIQLNSPQHPTLALPHPKFETWEKVSEYYNTIGKQSFFDCEISGGAALARLLKECETTVRFAKPGLPESYDQVLAYLKKELSQSGGIGCGTLTVSWQDVITKLFQR